MSESRELTRVQFQGSDLVAIRRDPVGDSLVALKPITEGMGLNWRAQLAKVKDHPVLSPRVAIIATRAPGDDRPREHAFLPLNRLNFWLTTINTNKVAPELRAKIIQYQTECADALYAHFAGKALVVAEPRDLDAELRRTGGVAKAVMHKQLEPVYRELAQTKASMNTLTELVQRMLDGHDPHQAVVTQFQPMLNILMQHKVEPAGRRQLSQRCSSAMRRWCQRTGHVDAVRISRETGRLLFHTDRVADWLTTEGLEMIRHHVAQHSKQGDFGFRAASKSKTRPH